MTLAVDLHPRAGAIRVFCPRRLFIVILPLQIVAHRLPNISEDTVVRSKGGECEAPIRSMSVSLSGLRRGSGGAQVDHKAVNQHWRLQNCEGNELW